MKWMQVVIGIMACAISSAHAYSPCRGRPPCFESEEFPSIPIYYLGLNYKQYWIAPKEEWNRLFPRSSPGLGFFLGWRFLPTLAIEGGYERSNKEARHLIIPNGGQLLGVTNTSGFDIHTSGRLFFQAGYLDLHWFFPIPYWGLWGFCFRPEAIVSIGVATMMPDVTIRMDSTDPLTGQFSRIRGRSQAVGRIGLGLQALVTENLGIRMIWRFEQTSALRVRNNIGGSPSTQAPFKNGTTFVLGIYWMY